MDFQAYNSSGGGDGFVPYNAVAQPAKKKTSIGQKIMGAATAVSNFVGAKGITDQFGADIARASVPDKAKGFVEYPSFKSVLGSAVQTGANLIPGAGVEAGLAKKVALSAATGYAYDVGSKLQDGKSTKKSLVPGVGTAVGVAFPLASALVGALTKRVAGVLSGSGTDVINRAIKYPDAVKEAVHTYARTPEAKQELVGTANDAISTYLQTRGKNYSDSLSQLVPKGQLTKETAVTSFIDNIKKFGGTVGPKGLEFSNSSLTKTDQNNLRQAFSTIKNWSDYSVPGLDTLRQAIGNHMADYSVLGNPRANVVLGSVKKDLTSYLDKNAAGYGQVLKNYGQQTELAKVLSKELSLGGQAKPSTQLNQVLRLFKKDPQLIKNLEATMGKEGASKFMNEISGAILSEWLPPGKLIPTLEAIGGSALGVGGYAAGIGGATLAPAALVGAGMSSPRIVGKAARLVGQAAQSGLTTGLKKGASLIGSKFNQ